MSDDTDDIGEARLHERVQSLVLSVADTDAFLHQLSLLATKLVEGSVACGITVRYDGQLLTVGSSDPRAEALDETQYRANEGPCLESLRTGEVVVVVDIAAEERWPGYLPTAREAGLRCSLSLPLTLGPDTFGAMNLYGFDGPGMFEPSMHRQAELFAAQAAGTLRLANRQVRDGALMDQMEEALRSRTTIDQAMGVIMAEQRCGPDQAFALLRAQSQSTGHRLSDVAAELVVRVSGQPAQAGRPFDID